jgi:hypothetical protein
MKNLRFSALLALVLIASIDSLQAGSTPTRITSSGTIMVPGSYVLANDITGVNGIGIGIQASDVTLNLNGHTVNSSQGDGILIYQNDAGGVPIVNARVSNGRIIASYGVTIYGSDCLITGLNITVSPSGGGINIKNSQFNRVHDCMLTGQQAETAIGLFLASQNTIQNCTLAGSFLDTIEEQDQVNGANTVIGNNTFSGIQWTIPTP